MKVGRLSDRKAFGRASGGVLAVAVGMSALCMDFSAAAHAQPSPPEMVEDRNLFIPMRDGVRLATDIFKPAGGGPYPIVLVRSPYGKDRGMTGQEWRVSLVRFLVGKGYAVAIQDKRGRFRSEGDYVASGGDAEDGYDTVDWLSKQGWSNGRVGAMGCSYEGDIQIFMAGSRHPALKAIVPMAAGSSVGSLKGQYRYFGVRAGGAVDWAGAIGWFAENGQKLAPRLPADLPQDAYNSLAAQWQVSQKDLKLDYTRAWRHLPMKDALKSLSLAPTDFEDNIARPLTDPYFSALPYMTDSYRSDVPALHINSWYDFGVSMTMLQFNHMRDTSLSKLARDNQFAVISPHTHCSFERAAAEKTLVGHRDVGDTRLDYRNLYLTWFDAWLKNDAAARRRIAGWPRVRYFAMGRNRWEAAPAWPVPGARDTSLYLDSLEGANSLFGDGRLLKAQPSGESRSRDDYVYDPDNPVPSRGGGMCCTASVDATPGAVDQRPVESRQDVLVYDSELLTSELNVTGDVRLILYVSSSAIDTDFTAKLVDVYPDGRAFNLLESILRARHREGLEREVWMEPNKVYRIELSMGPISNVFLRGHKVRLEVSSSNFPRFDRNLNIGGNNAEQVRWAVARNAVHHTPQLPSQLVLPVVGR
jgi:hypothetical protein